MIYFKYVRWRNLLSTGNTFTEIQLNKNPTTLIIGENGAGKSTLIEAISYGLYGKPFRKINKPQLINSINNKNMLVEVEFNIGSKEYLIRRGIKPNIFEIIVDGNLLNQDASVRDYQEILEKNILRLSHKSFSQIITLGASTFIPFMQLPAHSRREFIEDLLDIQIFSTMNIILKSRIQENKDNIADCSSKLSLCEQKIELSKKHIKTLQQNTEEMISIKRKSINEQEEIKWNISKKIDNNRIIIELEKQKEIDAIYPNITKRDKFILLEQQLRNKLDKINSDIEFYDKHKTCPKCKQDIDHNFHSDIQDENQQKKTETENGLSKIKEQIDDLNLFVEKIKTLKNDIIILSNEMKSWDRDIIGIDNYIKNLVIEIETLQQQKQKIEEDSIELNSAKDELIDIQKKKENLTNERSVLGMAGILLKDGGIKTQIIKQYVPIMNKLINKYLASLDFFVDFQLDENFEEKIKSRFRDEFSYGSFSEGEKMRINLALLFTWRAVSKLRNSASTNLLIMDEVFDSSLDTSGTEEFFKILESVSTDNNIFVISHKGEQLIDKFSNIIKFEKTKNFSVKIEQ